MTNALVFRVAVELRDLYMLCLLALEVLGWKDILSAFLLLHLLDQLSDTEEVIHSFE